MFRDAVLRCPSCGDSLLRPYAGRLVCDRCSGFLLTLEDLQRALQDLSGLEVSLDFLEEQPGERACPRCTNPMTQCRLRATVPGVQVTTKELLDRCLADGVWFDTGELEDVMARLQRGLTHRSSR